MNKTLDFLYRYTILHIQLRDKDIIMTYDQLSEEAQEALKNMVWACINHGICMGMDEGYHDDDSKRAFREELEAFSGFKS